MKYQIKLEQPLVKRMDHLGKLFHLTDLDMLDDRESILDAIDLLTRGKKMIIY